LDEHNLFLYCEKDVLSTSSHTSTGAEKGFISDKFIKKIHNTQILRNTKKVHIPFRLYDNMLIFTDKNLISDYSTTINLVVHMFHKYHIITPLLLKYKC